MECSVLHAQCCFKKYLNSKNLIRRGYLVRKEFAAGECPATFNRVH